MTTPTEKRFQKRILHSFLLSCVLALYLFYLDEGYFSINWMFNVGNWLMFVWYVSLFSIFQILLARIFLYQNSKLWGDVLTHFSLILPVLFIVL